MKGNARLDEREKAASIERSIGEGKCAWCQKPILGWPDTKGLGDNQRGRFCSVSCIGNMYGPEFYERHIKKLKASEN